MTDPETTVIDSKIDELTRQAAEDRRTKATADDKVTDTETRLAALRAAQREIDANQKTYEAAHPDLLRNQRSFEEFRRTEKTALEDLLNSVADEVRKGSAALDTKRHELRLAAEAKADELRTAEDVRDAAKIAVKEKTDLAGQYRKLAASVTARHTTLKSSRDEIEKIGNERQYALAYLLLIRDFTDRLNAEPEVIEPAGLQDRLLEALDDQGEAEAELVGKERAVADAKVAYTDAKAALDDHIKNGETRLRDQLGKTSLPEDHTPPSPPVSPPDEPQSQTPDGEEE
ncbi:hypothetical protein [Streptomyces sp. NPDC016845]|uniref:hypothetical protein n=1 Tax=Streptomyces sp. NPDC016845 TaxID=3364972 RepID=UPI0037BC3FB8